MKSFFVSKYLNNCNAIVERVCDRIVCKNGGACVYGYENGAQYSRCVCPLGFEGEYCEQESKRRKIVQNWFLSVAIRGSCRDPTNYNICRGYSCSESVKSDGQNYLKCVTCPQTTYGALCDRRKYEVISVSMSTIYFPRCEHTQMLEKTSETVRSIYARTRKILSMWRIHTWMWVCRDTTVERMHFARRQNSARRIGTQTQSHTYSLASCEKWFSCFSLLSVHSLIATWPMNWPHPISQSFSS